MTEQSTTELPPDAMGNEKWHDITDAVWMRSSLSDPESEAIVEVAEWFPSPLLTPKAHEEYERRQYEEAHTSEAYARMGRIGRY